MLAGKAPPPIARCLYPPLALWPHSPAPNSPSLPPYGVLCTMPHPLLHSRRPGVGNSSSRPARRRRAAARARPARRPSRPRARGLACKSSFAPGPGSTGGGAGPGSRSCSCWRSTGLNTHCLAPPLVVRHQAQTLASGAVADSLILASLGNTMIKICFVCTTGQSATEHRLWQNQPCACHLTPPDLAHQPRRRAPIYTRLSILKLAHKPLKLTQGPTA